MDSEPEFGGLGLNSGIILAYFGGPGPLFGPFLVYVGGPMPGFWLFLTYIRVWDLDLGQF